MELQKYHKGADAGDNEFTSFVNYMVTKKVEGKYKLRRIMMVLGYIIVGLAYAFVFTVAVKLPALLTFTPLLIWFIVYSTWMYVNIEYEYTMIAPYAKEREKADSAEIVHRCYCVSSMSSPDVWFGIYTNEAGEKCAVYFEVVGKTLKCLKYYNADAVSE